MNATITGHALLDAQFIQSKNQEQEPQTNHTPFPVGAGVENVAHRVMDISGCCIYPHEHEYTVVLT